ncbi:MAG: SAM-dependent methyltransferase [Krumholzibacteria bacterium]|nr:SAM-dependent methyltransferase [Candidatus Krumholzibacteria bacterium]
MPDGRLAGSFRDPGGFLFRRDGVLYRQVNRSSAGDLQRLHESGLYDLLVAKGLLIPHAEAPLDLAEGPDAACVIAPEPVPFISHPYEWCFSQLQDAALATLRIQKLALGHGMVLKDASAYNIQFHRGRPVLIDTLSLAGYREGGPWVAYRQFCQHFLAPLALMALVDVRLLALLRSEIDGVPLDLACRLLPWRTRLVPGLLMHLHLHAASQRRHADRRGAARPRPVSRQALLGIVGSLRGAVRRLSWRPAGTEWGDYYTDTNYSGEAARAKGELVAAFLDQAAPDTVWDLGANDGTFSRLAADRGLPTVAADVDPAAVEHNWRQVRERGEERLLPLLLDLTNPSPALGWDHAERASLLERGPAGCVLALALVHHLAISNNVPLDRLAAFFARAGRALIIEFVPKSDSQVRRLLSTREDVFPDYGQAGFEAAFGTCFATEKVEPIPGSERILYLMRRRGG